MQAKNPEYWSRGQLEFVKECPACGVEEGVSTIFERRDNEASMPDQWRMAQCGVCQSIWLDPRPDAKSLSRAYDNYYTHNAESDDIPQSGTSGLTWRLIHGYLNHRFGMRRQPVTGWGYAIFSLIEPWRLKLDYYGRHLTNRRVGKPGRLLDIGCGNGAFLARAVEMTWQVQGCEIDPKAAATCRSIGIDVLEGDAFHPSLTEQSFDVITMSHVLEHVADQPALLQRAHDLLRPGGWLWIAIPNPQSIGKRLFGSAWSELHPPCHLLIPSQPVLANWLKEKGFSKICSMRRGAHVRRIWRISQTIAQQETKTTSPASKQLIWRLIADTLATISPRWSEETVLLVQKPW